MVAEGAVTDRPRDGTARPLPGRPWRHGAIGGALLAGPSGG